MCWGEPFRLISLVMMINPCERMYTFDQRMASAVLHTGTKGWLVSILELGAWFGVLVTGYLADKLSRKYTIVLGASILRLYDSHQSLRISVPLLQSCMYFLHRCHCPNSGIQTVINIWRCVCRVEVPCPRSIPHACTTQGGS